MRSGGGVDEPVHQWARQSLQRLLPRVGRAQLVRGEPEAPALLLGHVGDESVVTKDAEQPVDRGPR